MYFLHLSLINNEHKAKPRPRGMSLVLQVFSHRAQYGANWNFDLIMAHRDKSGEHHQHDYVTSGMSETMHGASWVNA